MHESKLIVEAFRRVRPGARAALATLVSVEGSSYRRPGARMLITDTGETTGSLSAGCFDTDVCIRAKRVMATGQPEVVTYDSTNDDDIFWGLGLGCSGVVHVLIEPATSEASTSLIELMDECLNSYSPGAVATVFHVEGDVEVALGTTAFRFPDGSVDGRPVFAEIFDDLNEAVGLTRSSIKRYEIAGGRIDVLIEVLQPRARLVILGAGFDAVPLVDLAVNLGWHTSVVDTRARVSSLVRFQKADAVWLCRPEDVTSQISFSERTMVVMMTHNYLHDLELLRQLLLLPLKYLGCLGPRRRTERLASELADGDTRIAAAFLGRLHAPVGLDIGAETPNEIALSIVGEIKSVLAHRSGSQLRERDGAIHESFNQTGPALKAPLALAVGAQRVSVVCEV